MNASTFNFQGFSQANLSYLTYYLDLEFKDFYNASFIGVIGD